MSSQGIVATWDTRRGEGFIFQQGIQFSIHVTRAAFIDTDDLCIGQTVYFNSVFNKAEKRFDVLELLFEPQSSKKTRQTKSHTIATKPVRSLEGSAIQKLRAAKAAKDCSKERARHMKTMAPPGHGLKTHMILTPRNAKSSRGSSTLTLLCAGKSSRSVSTNTSASSRSKTSAAVNLSLHDLGSMSMKERAKFASQYRRV